jgi:hypothetical protein
MRTAFIDKDQIESFSASLYRLATAIAEGSAVDEGNDLA